MGGRSSHNCRNTFSCQGCSTMSNALPMNSMASSAVMRFFSRMVLAQRFSSSCFNPATSLRIHDQACHSCRSISKPFAGQCI